MQRRSFIGSLMALSVPSWLCGRQAAVPPICTTREEWLPGKLSRLLEGKMGDIFPVAKGEFQHWMVAHHWGSHQLLVIFADRNSRPSRDGSCSTKELVVGVSELNNSGWSPEFAQECVNALAAKPWRTVGLFAADSIGMQGEVVFKSLEEARS